MESIKERAEIPSSPRRKLKKSVNFRKRKRTIFYFCVMALPVIQFLLFYVYVNFNSFVLAFQHYELRTDGVNGYDITFAAFDNFKTAWEIFTTRTYMLKNSLTIFFACTLLGITLALIFSYYIYKKYPMAGFYKVILFMPQIISSIVFTLLFKYFSTDAYIAIAELFTDSEVLGLLDNPDTQFGTIVFYNVWVGFGVNVLMFSGAMSGINSTIVESAELDGVNILQEFIFITLPMIFETIVSFLMIALAGVFTNQANLYTLYDAQALDVGTIGYYLFVQTQKSDVIRFNRSYLNYPELVAFGLILTAIVITVTLVVKKLLKKFGPSID